MLITVSVRRFYAQFRMRVARLTGIRGRIENYKWRGGLFLQK